MRRLALVLLCAACAHASRSRDPQAWSELRSEHFVLRTDLEPDDARKAIAELELIRASLLSAGWHSSNPPPGRTQVVELASEKELREFAMNGIAGFVSSDAFDEPVMVVSAAQDLDEQDFIKHELTHVITNQFLVSKPRWVIEGLACYLETLKIDRGKKVVMGKPGPQRLLFLQRFPVLDYGTVMRTGREFETMDAQSGYAFETGAWLLVHWLVDTRPQGFDAFLNRLARGEEAQRAFVAEFPDLTETAIRAGVRQYWTKGKVLLSEARAPSWDGPIEARKLDAAEVYAQRADLLRLSPGFRDRGERAALEKADVALALQADPANPLALKLSPGSDPQAAVAAHADDWRAWVLVGDAKKDPAAFLQAAKLAPDNAGVLARLAILDLNRGDKAAALQHSVRAAELAPGRSDVLDVLAQTYAFLGRCDDADRWEQRAIDALSDAAPGSSVAELRKRKETLALRCGEQAIEQRVLVQPVLKRCSLPVPRPTAKDHPRGLEVQFTIREDGSVADVALTGSAAGAYLSALKKYFESCTYEAIVVDGKPLSVKSSLRIDSGERK
jgi:tetratricopeptide (TPR) repeat protein